MQDDETEKERARNSPSLSAHNFLSPCNLRKFLVNCASPDARSQILLVEFFDPANGLSFSTNPKDFPTTARARKIRITEGREGRGWVEEQRQKRRIRWNRREERKKRRRRRREKRYKRIRSEVYTAISIGAGKRTVYNGWNIVPSKPLSDISSTFLFLLFRVFPRKGHVASPSFPFLALPSLPITLFCPSYKTVYLVWRVTTAKTRRAKRV